MSLEKQGVDWRRTFNTFFNPLEHKNIYSGTNATPLKKSLTHGATLAMGYGTLGFALRRLLQVKEKAGQAQGSEKLKAYVNARYPIMSLDPDVQDVEEEKAIRQTGVQPSERYRETPMVEKAATTQLGMGRPGGDQFVIDDLFPGGSMKEWAFGKQHTTAVAAALAGLAAGTAGGWKLADYIADKARKKELGEGIQSKQNEIDKLMYTEYMRTRGLDKTAAGERMKLAPLGSAVQQSQDKPMGVLGAVGAVAEDPASIARVGASIAWVGAAALLALGYKSSKMYLDAHDPARKRLSELQAITREKAKAKEAPILMEMSNLPKAPGAVKTPKKSKPLSSVALPASSDGDRAVDPQDPYAALLTMN